MEYNSSGELNKCTAYVSVTLNDGQHSRASGFFLKFDNKEDVFLVTNRHVIENGKVILISFGTNINDPVYRYATIPSEYIYEHPDKNIDLCLINTKNLPYTLDVPDINNSKKYLIESMIITSDEVSKTNYIEDIVMFGAPRSIYDLKKSLSIALRGSTATPINESYASNVEFLIDIPAYPGSSGSPVFLCNNYTMSDFSKTKLVGIFCKAHVNPYNKSEYMHLGHCIPAWKLLDFRTII